MAALTSKGPARDELIDRMQVEFERNKRYLSFQLTL